MPLHIGQSFLHSSRQSAWFQLHTHRSRSCFRLLGARCHRRTCLRTMSVDYTCHWIKMWNVFPDSTEPLIYLNLCWHRWYRAKRALPAMRSMADRALLAGYHQHIIISEALLHSPEGNFTGNTEDVSILDMSLKITNLRLKPHLQRQWVNAPCASYLVRDCSCRDEVWRQHQCGHNSRHLHNRTGPWFNIKMLYYQYRKFHCADKMVIRSSYLHNGNSWTGKMASLYGIGTRSTKIQWHKTPVACQIEV